MNRNVGAIVWLIGGVIFFIFWDFFRFRFVDMVMEFHNYIFQTTPVVGPMVVVEHFHFESFFIPHNVGAFM